MKHIMRLVLPGLFALLLLLAMPACEDDEPNWPAQEALPEVTPTVCSGELSFNEEATAFSFTAAECGVSLDNATVRLAWQQGIQFHVASAADYTERTVEETETGWRWTLGGLISAPGIAIDFVLDETTGTLILRAELSWSAGRPSSLDIAWVELPAATNNAGVRLPVSQGHAAWLQNGHDSWSFTGIEALEPGEGPPQYIDGTIGPCAENYNYFTTCHGISWWMGGVAGNDRGPGLLWGALAAESWKVYAAGWYDADIERVRFQINQGTPGDAFVLEPGATFALEPIWLKLAARPAFDLYEYAQAAAQETPPRELRPSPFGWATWYEYFSEIDQNIVLENCKRMRQYFPDEEELLCQIDDGYETLFGDWYSYTPGFPDGMAPVAEAIREMGMTPGLWMAPLLVDERSELIAQYPQWFLYDVNGAPVLFDDLLAFKTYWVLDVTQPEAAQHLEQIVADKVADGFTYLKLDFLFAGAYEGVRADGSTALEAYHRALDIIRKAAGDDTYLLASGQPWLPSLGAFHAARDSSDIAGSFPGIPMHTMTVNLGRYHSIRAMVDGIWFMSDPDNLVVRQPLTDSQADLSIIANYLAGSSNLLGDSLINLPADRAALLRSPEANALRGLGGRFWAIDLFQNHVAWPIATPAFDLLMVASNPARIWVRADGDERIVALFAWGLLDDSLSFNDYDLVFDGEVSKVEITHLFGVDAKLTRDGQGCYRAKVPAQSAAVYRLVKQ